MNQNSFDPTVILKSGSSGGAGSEQGMENPHQPTYTDHQGVVRFKANAIVRFLMDAGNYNMNTLGRIAFSNEDRRQFAQLIGYSVDGYKDLFQFEEDDIEISDERPQQRCSSGTPNQSPSPR